MSNLFQVEGWVAKELQDGQNENGPYIHFRLGENGKEPRYYQCIAFGESMQALRRYKVQKGSRLLLSGQLRAEIGPKFENGQQTNEQEIKFTIFVESVRLTGGGNTKNNNQANNTAGAQPPAQAAPPPYNAAYTQQQQPLAQPVGYPTAQQQGYAAPMQQQKRQYPTAQQPMPQSQQPSAYPPPPDEFDSLPVANFG